MSIPFAELEGSPTIQLTPTGTMATRIFRVEWDQWQTFAEQLTGGWQRVGGQYRFLEPLPFPGLANVVVDSLHVAPFDPRNPVGENVASAAFGLNRYPTAGAKLTVQYKSAANDETSDSGGVSRPSIHPGTILTYRADLNVTTVSVPGRAWHWAIDDSPKVPDDVNPGLIMPTGSYLAQWDRVASPPWASIRSLRGKVNEAAFFDAPPGTLLFLGAKASRKFEFLRNASLWTVEYAFEERAVAWNRFFREESNSWTEIADAGDHRPYAAGDFAALFQFGG
jgi:hypothetical protein